ANTQCLAAVNDLWAGFRGKFNLEPGNATVWSPTTALWHGGVLVAGAQHCHSSQPRGCPVADGNGPALARRARGGSGGTARRHPQWDLWAVVDLCACAVGAFFCRTRLGHYTGISAAFSRTCVRRRDAYCWPHLGHYDLAFHHLGLSRDVPRSSCDPPGGSLGA